MKQYFETQNQRCEDTKLSDIQGWKHMMKQVDDLLCGTLILLYETAFHRTV